jgi:hypothetical protein
VPAELARRVDSLFARYDERPSPGLAVGVVQRDAGGGVTGVLVNAGPRNRNLRFTKVSEG